jgi:hypothetical protein
MAGFAVDLGDAGTAYERGVTMPSATTAGAAAQGLNQISRGLFGVLDDVAAAQRRAAPTESQIDRQAYAGFVGMIDKARGVEDPAQVRSIVNSAVATYESQGFQIGDAEAEMVRRRTGIDLDYLTFDPEQEAQNAALKKLTENPEYLFRARQQLEAGGKPYTEQDIMNTALSDMTRSEAAGIYLSTAQNVNRQEYYETFIPNANKYLEDIRSLAVQGLSIEMEGGNVSPESIVQLRTKFDMTKSLLAKPQMINNEDWQPIQSQIDTLDALLTSLESYDERMIARTKAETLEVTSSLLLKQAKELAATDPILAQALLSDKVDWSAYVNSKYPELITAIQDIKAEDSVYQNLPVFPSPDAPEIETTEMPPKPTDIHYPDEVEKAEDRDMLDRRLAITVALGTRVNLTEPQSLNQPEHLNNFLAGIGQATVNIATSPELLRQETMNQLFSKDTFDKLATVKRLDPESYELATKRLQSALQAQFNVYSTTASGALKDSYFNITGVGQIEYDLERRTMEGEFRMGPEAKDLINGFAGKMYNGDVTAMIADRGRKLSTFERSQIENAGFKFNVAFQEYREIQKVAQGMKFYTDNMKKLGMDTSAIESTIVKPVNVQDSGADLGTINNPFQIFWSDNTDSDEKLFASLDDGQYFIGPDGNTYVKGQQ